MKKKKKNLFLLLALSILTIIPTITAFASLKSNTIGLKRNFVETDGTKRYEITANLNGGQFPKNSIPNFTQKDDGTFTYSYQPIATAVKIPTPTKDGMNFKGWTINSDINNILNEYSIPAWNKENIKLTANWTPINSTLVNGTTFNNKIKSISGYTKIEFIKKSNNAATKNGIDVSQAQDKSTIAYLEGDTLKIASFGNIYANPDASNMFIGLSNITDITFNNFNTSKTTNMDSMFKTCTKLKSIDLTKLDTSNVTNMHDTFCGCSSITNFNIETLDTSSLTSMHGTFYDCDGLTTLNLNSLDTSKVTNMSFLVAECNNLKSIQIDKLNVSNVTTLRHMFKFCNNLQNLKLPNFNFNKIKDTEQMFDKCYKLTGSMTINGTATNAYREMFYLTANDPNAKFYVKYIDNATKTLAQNMVNTKTQDSHVYIQDTTTLVNGTEFNNALKKVINGFSTGTTVNIMFEKGDTSNITTPTTDVSAKKDGSILMYVPNNRSHNGSSNRNIKYAEPNTTIKNIIIKSNKDIILNANCDNMFSDILSESKLYHTTINLNNTDVSNIKTANNMFKNASAVKTIYGLENLNLNYITSINNMFEGCLNLTGEITIPENNNISYTNIFTNCSMADDSTFIVNYTSEKAKEIAKQMVTTKSNNSRIFLFGEEIPQIKENIMISGSKFNQILKPMLYSPDGPEEIDIIFEKGNPDTIPSNAFNINDISENKDGSIKLYAIKGGKYNLKALSKIVTPFTSTEIHIISEKPILFNQDSSSMFDVSNISSNIQTIRFNNIDTSKTTNMAYMFKGCNNINQLDLTKFNLSNVSDVREMFNGCSYLSSELTINNENIANYSNMFKDCSTQSTSDFVVKYNNAATKTLARNMVNTKSSNSNVRLYGETKSTLLNGTKFNRKIQSLPNINRMTTIQFLDHIPENINPNNIDVSLAQNNSIIAYIAGYTVIVASNDTIMANEDSSEMFKNLAVNNIEFNNFNTSNVTNMYNMFYNCGSLKNINFNNFDTSKVRDMSCMFSYCDRLENLDLSSFDTSNVTNMYNMFNYCSVLTRINGIENFNTSKLINSTYMFNRCNALSGEITISNIDTTDFSGMFSNCSTNSNTLFKVNYSDYDCQYIAQDMVNTKSSKSNVRLGIRKSYSLQNNEPKIIITENNNKIQILN